MSNFVEQELKSQLISGGRALIHSLKPDEFEYYACTFELIDSNLDTVDIFHFPIMPSGMTINGQYAPSIKKTGRGHIVQTTDSFIGQNITLSGSFGRRFRLLLVKNTKNGTKAVDSLKLRTGYGATKVMESIFKKNRKLDKYGNPHFLVLHNFAFNMAGVVEVMNFSLSQSMENNMMWNYQIELRMISDYKALANHRKSKGELSNLLAQNFAQSFANRILRNFTPGKLVDSITRKR